MNNFERRKESFREAQQNNKEYMQDNYGKPTRLDEY
jgi:hypothetical protein